MILQNRKIFYTYYLSYAHISIDFVVNLLYNKI